MESIPLLGGDVSGDGNSFSVLADPCSRSRSDASENTCDIEGSARRKETDISAKRELASISHLFVGSHRDLASLIPSESVGGEVLVGEPVGQPVSLGTRRAGDETSTHLRTAVRSFRCESL